MILMKPHPLAVLSTFLIAASLIPAVSLAVEPDEGAFIDNWRRTDLPVANGEVDRTWMWGPEANTLIQWEDYAEAPDGRRLVQYFDKARMEDNSYRAAAPWDVTNGLLVVELITGHIQTGDSGHQAQGNASWINVAGDQGEFASSPTYDSLHGLRIRVDDRTGNIMNETVNRAGEVSVFPAFDARGATMAHYDDVTGHNVATVFWEFMHLTGVVYLNGEAADATLFLDPLYATGRPISEPYWVTIPVGGIEKDVLLQCFERRCLTYTPDNPQGWQVEAANVGEHYYEWRYFPRSGQIAFTSDGNIWIMEGNGSDPRQITATPEFDSRPLWSPDRTRLLYVREFFDETVLKSTYELWGVDVTTGEERRLVGLGPSHPYREISFDWAPQGDVFVASDGDKVVTIQYATGEINQEYNQLGVVFDLDWSPTESLILFKREVIDSEDPVDSGIYMLDPSRNRLTHIPESTNFDESPEWSPDGRRIVVSGKDEDSDERLLYVLSLDADEDGQSRQAIPNTEGAKTPHWYSAGDRIAYKAEGQLWIVFPEEPGPLQIESLDEFAVVESFSWSPDSASLVVEILLGGPSLYSVAGLDRYHNLYAGAGEYPDWSP